MVTWDFVSSPVSGTCTGTWDPSTGALSSAEALGEAGRIPTIFIKYFLSSSRIEIVVLLLPASTVN